MKKILEREKERRNRNEAHRLINQEKNFTKEGGKMNGMKRGHEGKTMSPNGTAGNEGGVHRRTDNF